MVDDGRYRLCDIGNMDQTPLAYDFLDSKCYGFKNPGSVWVKPHRSGRDRRQATLMVSVSADVVNSCKPLLVFHGKDNKRNQKIQDDEMKQYDCGVAIMWNGEAWCNRIVMIRLLRTQRKFASEGAYLDVDPNCHRLLSSDVFRGQKTDEVKRMFKKLNCTTSFIFSGCTGFVQVLDAAIKKPLKNRIRELSETHYEII